MYTYFKDYRLYHDDGLGTVKVDQKQKKVKKNIQKIFKENKLDIAIRCNMKIVIWTIYSTLTIQL